MQLPPTHHLSRRSDEINIDHKDNNTHTLKHLLRSVGKMFKPKMKKRITPANTVLKTFKKFCFKEIRLQSFSRSFHLFPFNKPCLLLSSKQNDPSLLNIINQIVQYQKILRLTQLRISSKGLKQISKILIISDIHKLYFIILKY